MQPLIPLNSAAGTEQERRPRICMLTSRYISRRAFQCTLYEAQDVLRDTDDVDLLGPEPGWAFAFKQHWQRRLLYRDLTRKLIFQNPGLHTITLNREYDLCVLVCQNYWDLLYFNAIRGWKDYCKTTVCWMDELWLADLPQFKYWLHALKQFDQIFIGCKETVPELSRILQKSCHWLPGGVDAIRFSPYPNPPTRSIDVYSIGRRWDAIHQSLLRAASRKEIFYVYDTFPGLADLEPYDYEQHRNLYSNLAKRSRYYVVAPAKMNVPEETQGQVEVGFRYYEAAAAGAVMIGQRPECSAFRDMFDWPEAVIEICPDGSDVEAVLSHLTSEPELICTISRRNAEQALLRHDWVYRWETILKAIGMEASPRMMARKQYLKELADIAKPSAHSKAVEGSLR